VAPDITGNPGKGSDKAGIALGVVGHIVGREEIARDDRAAWHPYPKQFLTFEPFPPASRHRIGRRMIIFIFSGLRVLGSEM
jgi:hypothetical protein